MAQPMETQPVSDDRPPQLMRGFSFRSALSLAFADVSPIAAVYAIFTLGLFAAGPKFFWAFPIVLIGQLLVAAVFGELASRWPYAGSVYQWSRHVRGTTWGWVAMWAYMWGLTLALGTLSYAASGFLLQIFGVCEPDRWQIAIVAILHHLIGSGDQHGRPQGPENRCGHQHYVRGRRVSRPRHSVAAVLSRKPVLRAVLQCRNS